MENENAKKSKNTLTSVAIVLILTVVTKVLGLVREALIGRSFGTGVESDAYVMAQKITTVILMSVGVAITVSVVPIITKHYAKGEEVQSNKFINKVMTFFLVIAVVLSGLVFLFGREYTSLIAQGFTDERLELTVNLVRILFPSILFIFAAYVVRAVLQAREDFWGYSIMSVPFNILIIFYLYFLVGDYGIYGLTVTTLIAWALQFLVLVPFTNRHKLKYKIDFKLRGDADIKEFFILLMPILVSTMVYSVSTMIDSSFASTLEEGRVAALNYGYMIYSSIAQTFIYSISAVLFPKLVENFNAKNFEEFKIDAQNIINNILYLMVPALFGFIVLSRSFVELLYRGGKFNIDSVNWTQSAFIFFSIGLVGFALQEIISKTFFAVNNTKIPTITSILSVILNFILNLIFIKSLGMKGLALATSISITFNAVVMYIIFQVKYGKWDNKNIILNAAKVTMASLIMYFSVSYILSILNSHVILNSNFLNNFLNIIIVGVVGVLIYGIVTYILRVKLTMEIVSKAIKKVIR